MKMATRRKKTSIAYKILVKDEDEYDEEIENEEKYNANLRCR